MNATINLQPIDYVLLVVYFGFVLGIGYKLKRSMKRVGRHGDVIADVR